MDKIFDRLYEHYHTNLFQFIFYMVKNRAVAEELVQEVYINVLRSYQYYEERSNEKTWLLAIARNVAIDYLRTHNRRTSRWLSKFDFNKQQTEDSTPLPDEILVQKEEVQGVYKCLKECTLDQQQVLILRYIQELSINETAEILNWSVSKVKTTQHRAIKALRELVDEQTNSQLKGVL
ncbi:RNA polymerase sigma factor SigX [Pseudalkalibacillus hwajinpoensis]|uniref:RNA polymerase sigma factor n=1 Tax=Guptibacillus hwajinpoensis TaxID=208199 RepID=A0A4U1MEW9_9BACL|nr:RNA polymerase sigma factor SigX [Pseudalkalibacillus hwajinpoensis]TKD68780.1 sigma-70 family RNA polymerase sigma factor [Pseudalkalibacillus hwajinpoensis]